MHNFLISGNNQPAHPSGKIRNRIKQENESVKNKQKLCNSQFNC